MQGGGKTQQNSSGGKGQSMYPTAPTNFQYNPSAATTPLPVANTPAANTGANTMDYYAQQQADGGTGM
jgi:hypothetical protein